VSGEKIHSLQRTLCEILKLTRNLGRPPTLLELTAAAQMGSQSVAHEWVAKLRRIGVLRDEGQRIAFAPATMRWFAKMVLDEHNPSAVAVTLLTERSRAMTRREET
jgi:hypothetical protein